VDFAARLPRRRRRSALPFALGAMVTALIYVFNTARIQANPELANAQ